MLDILFLFLLIVASAIDIKTKIIPPWLIVIFFVVGLFHESEYKLLGLFITALPFYLANLFDVGCVGGGDMYLMAAAGFYFGSVGGLIATFTGILLCFIIMPVWRKIKKINKNNRFALFPFLGTGCAAVILLGGYL